MVAVGWSSRFAFLMAATGFAVGLGNIWRFPYVAGENGGSAFVLIYLVCVVVIGIPILMAEIMLGRRGAGTPPTSLAKVALESDRSAAWAWVGRLSLMTSFAIVVVYTVVIGWVFYFLYLSISGGLAAASEVAAPLLYDGLIADPLSMIFWTCLALIAAGSIVYAGLEKGIEPAVKVLMPLLFLLLVALAIFNVFNGGFAEALTYLFEPDFSKVTPQVFLAAIGQAFFSIGVAMAGMMMFGAYLPKSVSIGSSALIIVFADTLVAVTAGLVIFPMVFNYGLDPAGGAGLIFQVLPVAFSQMGQAQIVGGAFFLLLSVAGVTSLVGLVEPLVAWIQERFSLTRHRAVLLLMLCALIGSTISVLSYNVWQGVGAFGMSLGALMDFVPNQIMLPAGGLLIALFAGWLVRSEFAADELGLSQALFGTWQRTLKFVVVPTVALILVTGLIA